MKIVKINLKTKITQEDETEEFSFSQNGEIVEGPRGLMIKYRENNQIPVRLVVKNKIVELHRTVDQNNLSVMRFNLLQKTAAEYISAGRKLDLEVQTNKIEINELPNKNGKEIIVEYDLYTGLYLVGNYHFKLIFEE